LCLGELRWFYWAVADLLVQGVQLFWFAVACHLLLVTGHIVDIEVWFYGFVQWSACLDQCAFWWYVVVVDAELLWS
jgi:hypothetical protein